MENAHSASIKYALQSAFTWSPTDWFLVASHLQWYHYECHHGGMNVVASEFEFVTVCIPQ